MTTPPEGEVVYFDRAGNEIDAATFTRLRADDSYRVLAQDDIVTAAGELVWVLTEWAGVNLLHMLPGVEPYVFQLTIGVSGADQPYGEVHRVEERAREAHREIVEMLRNGVPPDAVGALRML